MSATSNRLICLLTGLWWGSLCTVGLLVVPLLFKHLPTPAMAGGLAAKLFSAQTALSIFCCLSVSLLLGSSWGQENPKNRRPGSAFTWVLAGMFAALLSEFAVAPRIVAHDNLPLWHGVGSVLYLTQILCSGLAFWKNLSAPQT